MASAWASILLTALPTLMAWWEIWCRASAIRRTGSSQPESTASLGHPTTRRRLPWVRGGGGIYYDRSKGNPFMGLLPNPPNVSSPTQYYGTFSDIGASANSGCLAP